MIYLINHEQSRHVFPSDINHTRICFLLYICTKDDEHSSLLLCNAYNIVNYLSLLVLLRCVQWVPPSLVAIVIPSMALDRACAEMMLTSFLRDFASYLRNETITPTSSSTSYSHDPIRVWFWWAWNANSGDTGGMVSPSLNLTREGTSRPSLRSSLSLSLEAWSMAPDLGLGTTIVWYKARYLEGLGLCPWSRSAASCLP